VNGDEQVVVGVDGCPWTADVLDRSAAEAAARRCRLRIVHAFHWIITPDPYGILVPVDTMATAREVAEQLLGDTVSRSIAGCRAEFPEVSVHVPIASGDTVATLMALSGDAALLVVGF
jgi:nucleotide-binding universal stress UspA family protein